MSSPVFPMDTVQGVDINGVYYQYTAVKDPADPYTVSIQNYNANGNGFIFRETDDWTGKSGQTISKFIPVPYSPLGNWGSGSIDEVGIGSVVDPVVIYSYRFDKCADPQSDPECPGYVAPLPPPTPEIEIYDALDDDAVMLATSETDRDLYESEDKEIKSDDEEDENMRLEAALAASENALTISNGMTQAAQVKAMNIATNLNTYYAAQIPGKIYTEKVKLVDTKISDNKRAFRSLAQDKLHDQMIDQQWGR